MYTKTDFKGTPKELQKLKVFKSLEKIGFALPQWITSPERKTASVPKQAYMSSWPRQQRPAVALPAHC